MDNKTFVPFGIPAFGGEKENAGINFVYEVKNEEAKKIILQIRERNKEIYKKELIAPDGKPFAKKKYSWQWDGFDNNGILDTSKLVGKKLNFYITALSVSNKVTHSCLDFELSYSKVNWVDVRIDRPNKRIDVTLRIHLRDGGSELKGIIMEGSFAENNPMYPRENLITKSALDYYGKPRITTQQRSFEQLRDLALRGIEKHWSRNTSNKEGKSISIEYQKYQVFVKAIASDKGMVAPKIVYQSNCEKGRSRNWEASRILYFSEGYLYRSDWGEYKDNLTLQRDRGWYYRSEDKMEERGTFILSQPLIEDFMMTAAHEIGHEILVSFGGFAAHIHSKTHKGTSTLLTQETIEDENDKSKTNYPEEGEIDLMKY